MSKKRTYYTCLISLPFIFHFSLSSLGNCLGFFPLKNLFVDVESSNNALLETKWQHVILQQTPFPFLYPAKQSIVNWNLKANSHSLQKTHPSSDRPLICRRCTHSSLIGLAAGPQPKGRLYKTPYALRAGVRKQKGTPRDLQRADRETEITF